jgi:hypothetical protein
MNIFLIFFPTFMICDLGLVHFFDCFLVHEAVWLLTGKSYSAVQKLHCFQLSAKLQHSLQSAAGLSWRGASAIDGVFVWSGHAGRLLAGE